MNNYAQNWIRLGSLAFTPSFQAAAYTRLSSGR